MSGSRGRYRRFIVYGGITLFVMFHTIHQMFIEVRPFDWIMLAVEVLVLLLILYEVVVNIIRHRREKKRRERLQEILKHLSQFMDAGKGLQVTVPNTAFIGQPNYEWLNERVEKWALSVKQWRDEVKKFLSSRSGQALSAFVLIVDAESIDSMVHPLSDWPFRVTGELLHDLYQPLGVYLRNLQNIMEKVDIYF